MQLRYQHGTITDYFKAISDIEDYKLYIDIDDDVTLVLTEEEIRETCD